MIASTTASVRGGGRRTRLLGVIAKKAATIAVEVATVGVRRTFTFALPFAG
jgi:hypothetical protein